jgi:hypothetical protein
MNPAALNSGSRSAPVSTMGGHAGRRRNAPDSRRPPGRSRPSHRGGRTPTTRFSGGVQAIADVFVPVTQASSSGSHTNSENHLFRSIRLRFAHNALPTFQSEVAVVVEVRDPRPAWPPAPRSRHVEPPAINAPTASVVYIQLADEALPFSQPAPLNLR